MPAGSHRFQVGTMHCTVLSDGYVEHPTSACFPNAGDTELAQALHCRGMAAGTVVSPYTCLLIETGRHIVLADTGLGSGSSTAGAILARLEVAGIRPTDVDTIVFTHAHPDHIGGAVDLQDPRAPHSVFPNARHVLAEAEWEFWMSPRADLRGMAVPDEVKSGLQANAQFCLRTLRHQLELIEGDREIVPGVHAISAPGHTPGHLALLLESEGSQLLNLGDAALHPLHLEHPEWRNGFDWAPDCALATRAALLERAAAEGMHVMAFHFPFPSVGRVAAQARGGWEWTPGW